MSNMRTPYTANEMALVVKLLTDTARVMRNRADEVADDDQAFDFVTLSKEEALTVANTLAKAAEITDVWRQHAELLASTRV